MGKTKKLGLALTREQPLLPGDPQGVVGPQGGGAEAVGEGSGGARAGSTQGGGRAVWSSWQEILGSDGAGDIGNYRLLVMKDIRMRERTERVDKRKQTVQLVRRRRRMSLSP